MAPGTHTSTGWALGHCTRHRYQRVLGTRSPHRAPIRARPALGRPAGAPTGSRCTRPGLTCVRVGDRDPPERDVGGDGGEVLAEGEGQDVPGVGAGRQLGRAGRRHPPGAQQRRQEPAQPQDVEERDGDGPREPAQQQLVHHVAAGAQPVPGQAQRRHPRPLPQRRPAPPSPARRPRPRPAARRRQRGRHGSLRPPGKRHRRQRVASWGGAGAGAPSSPPPQRLRVPAGAAAAPARHFRRGRSLSPGGNPPPVRGRCRPHSPFLRGSPHAPPSPGGRTGSPGTSGRAHSGGRGRLPAGEPAPPPPLSPGPGAAPGVKVTQESARGTRNAQKLSFRPRFCSPSVPGRQRGRGRHRGHLRTAKEQRHSDRAKVTYSMRQLFPTFNTN